MRRICSCRPLPVFEIFDDRLSCFSWTLLIIFATFFTRYTVKECEFGLYFDDPASALESVQWGMAETVKALGSAELSLDDSMRLRDDLKVPSLPLAQPTLSYHFNGPLAPASQLLRTGMPDYRIANRLPTYQHPAWNHPPRQTPTLPVKELQFRQCSTWRLLPINQETLDPSSPSPPSFVYGCTRIYRFLERCILPASAVVCY